MLHKRIIAALLLTAALLGCSFLYIGRVRAQTRDDVQQTINELQQKISDLQGQEDTLAKQIKLLDSQIALSELHIRATKNAITGLDQEISQLDSEVVRLENSMTQRSQLLLARIPEAYKRAQEPMFATVFLSNNFSDFLLNAQYAITLERSDANLLLQLKDTQQNFQQRKDLRESKRLEQEKLQKQLEAEGVELQSQKQQKQTLLTETKGSEANYQKLLAAAKAQLAGFDTFTTSQGGGLLSGQTSCNDWGCYYNQRDSQWGGISLNHTKYTIASDGCLVTSMAMVLTHYGHAATPTDINNNPANFASYYPAYLLYTITVNGVTADRIATHIDSVLSGGEPVIVGVHAYGGTHFVVLVSGSGGRYTMYDPYLENGHDIQFTDHYTVGSIFEIDKVVIR